LNYRGDVIRGLVDRGADLNTQDSNGASALHLFLYCPCQNGPATGDERAHTAPVGYSTVNKILSGLYNDFPPYHIHKELPQTES
jgi:hypothetical protein